jgi:membrane fusion protein (multidrug efflux system)
MNLQRLTLPANNTMKHLNLFFTTLLLAATFVSCSKFASKENTNSSSDESIAVYQITPQSIDLSEFYVADIQAQQNVEVRTRVKGYLDKIFVDEGKFVKKGQLLFGISDDLYQTQLKKAKANTQYTIAEAKSAELTMKNIKLLVEKGVVNKTELDMAKAKYESLIAKVEEAKADEQTAAINLSHALIRAPFDGFLDRIPFKTGSVLNEGELLTSISDVNNMNVYFKVSEKEYLDLMKLSPKEGFSANGYQVNLVLADGSVFPNEGKIETIEGDFETGTGSIGIRAKFQNVNRLLKHNLSGKIKLTRKRENAIIVPQKATFEIQDKTFVYILDKGNKVTSKAIKPIKRINEYYLVEDADLAGKIIVYEGIQTIKSGDKINPKQISDKSLKAELN